MYVGWDIMQGKPKNIKFRIEFMHMRLRELTETHF